MGNYFTLGAVIDKSRFQTKSVQVEYERRLQAAGERGVTAVAPGTEGRVAGMDRIKAIWPRCGDAHKYEYVFADGRKVCTQGWRADYYYAAMTGKNPGALEHPSIISKRGPALWKKPWFLPAAGAAGLVGLALLLRKGKK